MAVVCETAGKMELVEVDIAGHMTLAVVDRKELLPVAEDF